MLATHCTPFLLSTSIERSIEWYQVLGFRLVDDDGRQPLSVARMHHEGGQIMFMLAEKKIVPEAQCMALYLYSPDLGKFREHLLAHGVEAPEVSYPPWMKGGEIRLTDPDGFHLFVGQWGKKEQEDWEKHLEERARREASRTQGG